MSTADKLKQYEARYADALKRGSSSATAYAAEVERLKDKLIIEEKMQNAMETGDYGEVDFYQELERDKKRKEEMKALQEKIDEAEKMGDEARIERYEDAIRELMKKWEREDEVMPVHPELVFGPVAQTIGIMCGISLVMSVTPLPYEMLAFYKLFSSISVVAMSGLVIRNSIIYYGYKQALSHLPPKDLKAKEQKEKWAKMRRPKPAIPDDWANPRAHPSHFLTTRHAPPKLFPFPLGKTRADATVKDELWWEGGNAPHVGHFKKRDLPNPPMPNSKALHARAELRIAMEAQEALWKKRIQSIQLICIVVIVSFVNRKAAIALLIYTIYRALTAELDSILEPPVSRKTLNDDIKRIAKKTVVPYSAASHYFPQGVQGMGHIYSPDEVVIKGGRGNAQIPIVAVPPPVLMTTDNGYYTGVGEELDPRMG